MISKSRLGIGTCVLALSAGCGAANEQNVEEGSTQTTTSQLSKEEFCDVIDSIGKIELGDADKGPIKVDVTPTCKSRKANSLSYLGSSRPKAFERSMPRAEAEVLYCTLRGMRGLATADATSATDLGTFGMKAHVNVLETNPEELKLKGQRIGTLYAFGVGMDIERQDFSWAFPAERQPEQEVAHWERVPGPLWPPEASYGWVQREIPAQQGQYASARMSGLRFGLDANASIPLLPGLRAELFVGFHSFMHSAAGNNRAYVMNHAADSATDQGARENARRHSWANFVAACRECSENYDPNSLLLPNCDCPSDTAEQQHARRCGPDGCTEDYYANLDDGRLPHEGRSGASGSFYDAGSHPDDFWHFGLPGNSRRLARGEPRNAINRDGREPKDRVATTTFDLNFGLHYDAGIAEIGLTIGMGAYFRNGLAVREYHRYSQDMGDSDYQVAEAALDAETSFNVDARLVVDVNIPFAGKTTVLDETFDLIKPTPNNSEVSRSEILWQIGQDGANVLSYRVDGKQESFAECLAKPPLAEEPEEVRNPAKFITKVEQSAQEQLHPCHVKICAPHNSEKWLHACEWNAETKKLECEVVRKSCSCDDASARLCDSRGNVYKPKSSRRPACYPTIE